MTSKVYKTYMFQQNYTALQIGFNQHHRTAMDKQVNIAVADATVLIGTFFSRYVVLVSLDLKVLLNRIDIRTRRNHRYDICLQNYFCSCLLLICIMKDNLRSKINNWKYIGASDTVLHWIENGAKFHIVGDITSFEVSNGKFSDKEEIVLNSEITNLLLFGIQTHMYVANFMCTEEKWEI